MCIRDRVNSDRVAVAVERSLPSAEIEQLAELFKLLGDPTRLRICLLYTSDAADERSSVDLGGRRIIKKKKHVHQ